MWFVWLLIGLVTGGFFGVVGMCLVQINSLRRN
ncbi:MAG: DUF3789 domain-containing protein [Clostridia bacterium]|nr:DUF3789 domain-containing protein [Clostridia bacterium]